ncbi:sensor histidine kinase [Larkinella rosea]|uniref:GHKL domain-containing protein n=1 Tax=Larkinella rosea TaxID=2025312 RepID=A0A3P1BZX3_9BACT|nr:histidine kinase [Larkinella rosea]RRB06711.1 GHKL domain-containing protein [Larkinella rosea]
MKKDQKTGWDGLSGTTKHLLIGLLAALPIYLASALYTKTIVSKDDEEAALAATVFFLGGVYIGRYIAQLWVSKNIPGWLFAVLSAVSILCIIWIFFHADFPLQESRIFLNLLLFYLPLFIVSVAIGMLIKLGRLSVANQVQEAKAQAVQSQSELHLLQSQLSPHFLFNTLNNLYGISITQHDKIPILLLKLSDLLRYSVYDAKELFVPLKDELAYIHNYIDFEKIRIGNRLFLTTSIEDLSHTNIRIAPMLLIVFIENAFKHAKNSLEHRILIDISLRTWGNFILFSVKNSRGSENDETNKLENNSGFGLENVKKRLDLLYPNAHDLNIQDHEQEYKVMLQLKVK